MRGKESTAPTRAEGAKKEKTPIVPPEEQPPPPLEAGDRVGNYEILTTIGDGGMGCVYKAKHIHRGTFAAVKVLHAKFARNEQVIDRLKKEAKATIRHPHIVLVHDVGQRPETGEWYIILDYLDGSSLTKVIASWGGPMPLDTVMRIAAQLASALAKAHKHGIIHRDLKPENIFVMQAAEDDANPHAMILDFGIARVPSEDGRESDTRTGVILGTPSYMAPEQLRDETIDHRIDVYALGIVIWEMTTGRRLWGAARGNLAQIAVMQASGSHPIDPCRVVTNLAPAWGAAIARALAPKPEDRFQDMGQFARALAMAFPKGPDGPWSPTGWTILTQYAKELTKGDLNVDTAGRPIEAANHSPGAVVEMGPPSVLPDVALTPPPVNPHAISRSAVTAGDGRSAQLAALPLGPTEPTTLGGVAAQSMTVARPTSRRRIIAIAMGAISGLALVAILASMGDEGGERRPVASPPVPSKGAASTSALAIVTEPAGALITFDGVASGEAPVNIAATIGAEVEVRAELANHAPAIERVRIGAAPMTVRLTLGSLADAAVVPIDAGSPVDAPPRPSSSGRRRTSAPPARSSGAWDPDDVVDP